jgi:hypothetical protein
MMTSIGGSAGLGWMCGRTAVKVESAAAAWTAAAGAAAAVAVEVSMVSAMGGA